jgi:hypothetical protein
MDVVPIVLAALAAVIMTVGAASLINIAIKKRGPNVLDV